jgi:hypothetical protein
MNLFSLVSLEMHPGSGNFILVPDSDSEGDISPVRVRQQLHQKKQECKDLQADLLLANTQMLEERTRRVAAETELAREYL